MPSVTQCRSGRVRQVGAWSNRPPWCLRWCSQVNPRPLCAVSTVKCLPVMPWASSASTTRAPNRTWRAVVSWCVVSRWKPRTSRIPARTSCSTASPGSRRFQPADPTSM